MHWEISSQLPQNQKCLEQREQDESTYHTSASKHSRYLTVSFKRVKAHRIVTDYFFSHVLVLRAPDLDSGKTLVLGISIVLLNGKLYKALGERASVCFHGPDIPTEVHLEKSAPVESL